MRVRINKNIIFPMLLLIVLLLPITFINYLNLTSVINLLKYIGLGYAIIISIRLGIYEEKKWLPIHLWFVWVLVTTVIGSQALYSTISAFYPLYTAFVMTVYLSRVYKKKAICAIGVTFSCMLVYNLIIMFNGGLYRESIYNLVYFFGIRVNINDVWPFAMAIMLLAAHFGRKKDWLFCVLGLATGFTFVLFQWVSTAIVVTAIFALFYFYIVASVKWESKRKQIRMVVIILLIWIIWFAINPNVQQFSWLIEDILGESLTLDGRTDIWNSCLSQIKGIRWIIGHGYGHNYVFAIENGGAVTHPHNQYLAILFNFGIIGLVIYARLIFDQVKSFMAERNDKVVAIMGACILAMLVMGIGATFFNKVYWIVWYAICMTIGESQAREIKTV